MSDDKIQTLDLTDAADQIRDKIKLAFVDAIPDEQWKAMIQGELKKFMESRITYGGYRNETPTKSPPEFEVMAQAELKKHMAEQLADRIKGTDYIPDGHTFETLIVKWMDDNHKKLMDEMLQNMLYSFMTAILRGASNIADNAALAALVRVKVPDPNNPGYDLEGNRIQR